jgi:hypothetical protein
VWVQTLGTFMHKRTRPRFTFADPAHAPDLFIGWYRVRAISARLRTARTGTRGLRVELVLVDPPCNGLILARDFWFRGQARAVSTSQLDALGFAGLEPSAIAHFNDFERLPVAAVYVTYCEFEGVVRNELRSFASEVPHR